MAKHFTIIFDYYCYQHSSSKNCLKQVLEIILTLFFNNQKLRTVNNYEFTVSLTIEQAPCRVKYLVSRQRLRNLLKGPNQVVSWISRKCLNLFFVGWPRLSVLKKEPHNHIKSFALTLRKLCDDGRPESHQKTEDISTSCYSTKNSGCWDKNFTS